jgi:hypothetical protein
MVVKKDSEKEGKEKRKHETKKGNEIHNEKGKK